MKGLISCAFGVLLTAGAALAQNESDILRYSFHEVSGSLRNMGMGGTVGAVGADLSCAFSNPAGLGLYRRGDLGFNLGFGGSNTRISFDQFNQEGSAGNAPVTQAGIAITYPSIDPDWPFVTLAVSYQKRTELHQQLVADGALLDGSLLSLFGNQAQGFYSSELDSNLGLTAGPAWEAYLLDPDPSDPSCETCYITALDEAENVIGAKRIDRTGTVGETAISFAANYKDRLYLGASLGLPSIDYTETSRHEEAPFTDTLALNRWSYSQNLDIEGAGINVRAGVIWALADWMRIGVNYASRSRLSIQDAYSTNIEAQWNDGSRYDAASPLNQFDYIIYTPARFSINAAFIMGKAGIVSAEYERTDFRQGELRPAAFASSSAHKYEAENEVARNIHTVTHAARVGAEFRVARDYRLRLGAGMSPSPYSSAAEVITDATRYHGSFGWAYRGETWYAGFSYVMTIWDEDIYLWSIPDESPAAMQRRNGMLVLGVGGRM